MEKEPKPIVAEKTPPQEVEVFSPIPENPWIDDVGQLKDSKRHKELNELIKCHCLSSCRHKARIEAQKSYEAAFGKIAPAVAIQALISMYETYIAMERQARWGTKPIDIVDFTKWDKEQKSGKMQ